MLGHIFVCFFLVCSAVHGEQEPVCSKFDYEIKTLETMLRTESRIERTLEEIVKVRETVNKELDNLKKLKAKIDDQLGLFQQNLDEKIAGEMEKVQTNISERIEEVKQLSVASPVEMGVKDDTIVAFTVTNPTSKFKNSVPTFKSIITNLGNGYDVQTGIFTCPNGGLYMFVFVIGSFNNRDIYCYMYHNEKQLVIGRTGTLSYATSSTSVVILLRKNDRVKLSTCNWASGGNVYNSNGATTFRGFLIHPKS